MTFYPHEKLDIVVAGNTTNEIVLDITAECPRCGRRQRTDVLLNVTPTDAAIPLFNGCFDCLREVLQQGFDARYTLHLLGQALPYVVESYHNGSHVNVSNDVSGETSFGIIRSILDHLNEGGESA